MGWNRRKRATTSHQLPGIDSKTIDRTTLGGSRDYALLATKFNTGGRVQEIADLLPRNLVRLRLLTLRQFLPIRIMTLAGRHARPNCVPAWAFVASRPYPARPRRRFRSRSYPISARSCPSQSGPSPIVGIRPLLKTPSLRLSARSRLRLNSHDFIPSERPSTPVRVSPTSAWVIPIKIWRDSAQATGVLGKLRRRLGDSILPLGNARTAGNCHNRLGCDSRGDEDAIHARAFRVRTGAPAGRLGLHSLSRSAARQPIACPGCGARRGTALASDSPGPNRRKKGP